VYKTPVPASSF